MTTREEEQMTTPIDQKESLRRMIDNRTAAIRMALDDLESNMRELVQYEARLHATAAAPPDVREIIVKAFMQTAVISNPEGMDRKGAERRADEIMAEIAALPSAPVLPTRSQLRKAIMDYWQDRTDMPSPTAAITALIDAGFAVEDDAALAGDQQGEG